MRIVNLDYNKSSKFLYLFSMSNRKSVKDIATDRKNDANYIWIVKQPMTEDETEKPIGFLSYIVYPISNNRAFIYIVKIHVLEEYRREGAILFDEVRVSEILFKEIEKKEDEQKKLSIDVITLVSANETLDLYYTNLGFKNLPIGEVSMQYSKVINTNDPIKYRIKESSKITINDSEKLIFGV